MTSDIDIITSKRHPDVIHWFKTTFLCTSHSCGNSFWVCKNETYNMKLCFSLLMLIYSYYLYSFYKILCLHLSLVTRKPVFGVCDQLRHKPACTSTETRWRLEILNLERRGIILSRQRTTKALIRLCGCAG